MWTCVKCAENLDDEFDACWRCGSSRDGEPSERPELFDAKKAAHLRISQWRDTPGQLWMRCWIIACAMLLLAQFWAGEQHSEVRAAMQNVPRLLAGCSGFVLFVSSVFFCEHKTLRRIGIVISLMSMGLMLLMLLPALAN
jgi:hypothetical protein